MNFTPPNTKSTKISDHPLKCKFTDLVNFNGKYRTVIEKK